MKKVIVAIQSTLVREAVIGALKKRGFFAEKSLSQLPDKVAILSLERGRNFLRVLQ